MPFACSDGALGISPWGARHARGDRRYSESDDGQELPDYQEDWLLRRGVERGIEIISEASRTIPASMQALQADIPLPRIRAVGDVLRHEYHSLSDAVIWNVVIDELPRLKTALLAIRAAAEGD